MQSEPTCIQPAEGLAVGLTGMFLANQRSLEGQVSQHPAT